MRFAPEIELKISSYIEPDPVLYTRLATVCRFYYSLYTSDEKWRALDVEGVKTNLFKHYIAKADLARLKHCWSDYVYCKKDLLELYDDDEQFLVPPDALDLLGLLRHHDEDCMMQLGEVPLIEYEPYARVAIAFNHQTLSMVDAKVLELHPDMVEQCVRIDPVCFNYLDASVLVHHKELMLTELKRGNDNYLDHACITLLTEFYDRDFLWEVAEYQPRLYQLFDEVEGDPKITIKVAFYHKLLETWSRDKLKEVFSRPAQELYSDLELFRLGISATPNLLALASESIRDDEETVMQALKYQSECLGMASPRLQADATFCAAAVNSNHRCFNLVEDQLKENELFSSQLTFKGFPSSLFDSVPSCYWDDETVVLNAIRSDPDTFEKASERVQEVRQVALEAARLKGRNYALLDRKLQKDREIALLAMQSDPFHYKIVPLELQGDKEIAMAAASNTSNFNYFSDELQHDKDIVLKYLGLYASHKCPQEHYRLRTIPLVFCGDRDVALKLVRRLPASYFDLTDALRMDKEIVLAAFEHCNDEGSLIVKNPYTREGRVVAEKAPSEAQHCKLTCTARLAWVPESLRHDLEIARAATLAGPCNYNDLPEEVRRIKELAKLALDTSFEIIPERQVDAAFLPPELRDDEEIMSSAAKSLGVQAFSVASDRLKRSPRFLSALFESRDAIPLEIIKQIPAQAWADRELVLEAAKKSPDILDLAPLFRDDEEVVTNLLTNEDADPRLDLFSERLASDEDIILRAIGHNNAVLSSLEKPSKKKKPDWLDSACTKLRDTVARYFNDDIDVLLKYLEPPEELNKYSSYRSDILPHLSLSLRDNDDIITTCIRGGIHSKPLGHASARILKDRELFLKVFDITDATEVLKLKLSFMDPSDLLRFETMGRPVTLHNILSSLEFVLMQKRKPDMPDLQELFTNEEFMLSSVRLVEEYVQFAPKWLLDDKDFALTALGANKSGFDQLRFFSPRLRDDLDVVKLSFEKTVPQLELVSKDLRGDKELAIMAVEEDIEQRHFVSSRVREDPDFILTLISYYRSHGNVFDPALIPERVYSNKPKIMRLAQRMHLYAPQVLFEACSPRLRDDLDVAREVMRILISEAKEAGRTLHLKDGNVYNMSWRTSILKRALRVFASASQRLQAHPKLIAMVEQINSTNPYLVSHFLPDNLRDSKVFMMELVRLDPSLFRIASDRLRGDPDLVTLVAESGTEAKVYLDEQNSVNEKVTNSLPDQEESLAKKRRMDSPSDVN